MPVSTRAIIYIKIFQTRIRPSFLVLINLLIENINKQYPTFLVGSCVKDGLFFVTLFVGSENFCWVGAGTDKIIVDEDIDGEGGVIGEICEYW